MNAALMYGAARGRGAINRNVSEQVAKLLAAYSLSDSGTHSTAEVKLQWSNSFPFSINRAEQWLSNIPTESLIVLQSNNYEIDEHVRPAISLEEFRKQSKINELWSGSLKTQMYDRWMIIGKKCIQ